MQPLAPTDQEHVQAADGWVKLGALADAETELDALSAGAQDHPDVLQIRWLIAAQRPDWTACLGLAEHLVAVAPERRFGWLHLGESLHQLGRTGEAYERLAAAADALEPNATVPLQLARYACRLARLGEARQWLALAFSVAGQSGHRERLRDRALGEPDLAPLREEILPEASD